MEARKAWAVLCLGALICRPIPRGDGNRLDVDQTAISEILPLGSQDMARLKCKIRPV
jgi:hypothetical protein